MTTPQIPSEDRLWAAASYLWFVSIVALAARHHRPFVRFHASQGLLLFVAALVASIVPIVGWITQIVIFVVAVVGAVQAFGGASWPLPVGAAAAQRLGAWLIKILKL